MIFKSLASFRNFVLTLKYVVNVFNRLNHWAIATVYRKLTILAVKVWCM